MSIEPDDEAAYTEVPFDVRREHAVFRSVRELVRRHSVTRRVLDLGCSDGVATAGLDGYQVYGVDAHLPSLTAARRHQPGYHAIAADLRRLPFGPESVRGVDTVLLLDVLEHLPRPTAGGVLQGLRGLLPREHTLIVTMPIVSPLSALTWYEAALVAARRRRPATGLFDRTHHILAGRRAHHGVFTAGGYGVVAEYQSNLVAGVTGDWEWKTTPVIGDEQLDREVQARVQSPGAARALTKGLRAVRRVYARAEGSQSALARRACRAGLAYQGLYVLQPEQRRSAREDL